MTLSNLIKLKTNDGETVIDFLIDVMHDCYEDFQICHRLQAARLLTTYGNEDAPYFINDNPKDSSFSARNGSKPKRPTKFDTELARLIKEDTSDGRSIARFLINVMEGELTTFKPHHRISAARELLNRGFGKSAQAEKTAHPEPVQGLNPTNRHSRESGNPGAGEALTPHSPALTPKHTPSPGEEAQGESKNPAPTHPNPTNRHSRERGNPGAREALTPHSSPLTPLPLRGPSVALRGFRKYTRQWRLPGWVGRQEEISAEQPA